MEGPRQNPEAGVLNRCSARLGQRVRKDNEKSMEVEWIKFERTGGFAGMRVAKDFEMNELPDEQAQALLKLLEDLDFKELPKQMMGSTSTPDQFTYTITVETKDWKHTVVTGEASAPEKMQELLQLLNRLARSRPKD
jgi:hypothetical protein